LPASHALWPVRYSLHSGSNRTRSLKWKEKLPVASRARYYHHQIHHQTCTGQSSQMSPRSRAVAIHLGRSAHDGPHARAGESGIPKGKAGKAPSCVDPIDRSPSSILSKSSRLAVLTIINPFPWKHAPFGVYALLYDLYCIPSFAYEAYETIVRHRDLSSFFVVHLTSLICSSCQIRRSSHHGGCVGSGQALQTGSRLKKGSCSFCLRIPETRLMRRFIGFSKRIKRMAVGVFLLAPAWSV
jgi:hypothetical protein